MNVKDDYAFEPVPEDRTVSGFRVAVVLTGIIIALPSFIIGANLGASLGFEQGVLAVVLGGLVLSAISIATGSVGARTRLTTAMIARQTFGAVGGRIVSGVLAVACLGWFGVTAEVFGQSLHQILLDLGWDAVPKFAYIGAGGLLMISTTIFGFSALQRLSGFTVPLLAILIAYTAFLALRGLSGAPLLGPGNGETDLGDGISAIVGSLAVAVTIFPDLCRFSRRARDASTAAVLTYTVAMPLILLLAMIPSIVMQERELVKIMTTLGLGVPALALIVVKAWATNSGNLYIAALNAANSLASHRQTVIVITGGVIGTLVAIFGVTERFVPFLVALSVSIPPVAGIYVVDYWCRRRSFGVDSPVPAVNLQAFACWAFGITIAVLGRSGHLTLSTVSAIDSMLAAALTYLACCAVWRPAKVGDQNASASAK